MEQRTREKASRAVSDILKAAGFEVHTTSAPLDLSAIRNAACLLVMCSDDPDEAARFSETEYTIRANEGEVVCDKLLVTFNPTISSDDCIVWYPEEFALYAGEAVLARVLGKTLILPLNGMGESRASGATSPSQSKGGVRIAHLPVRVHRDDAEEKAGIPGVATLRFIPFWMFHYTSRGSAVYKDQEIPFDGTGSGALNAITGSVIDVDSDTVTRREIPGGSDVTKPTILREDAEQRIVSHLIKNMTRRVKIRQVKGDAIYYEEKNLAPDLENISVELRELYIPIWQIKGKKIVEINAHTGDRLHEPLDDGVEVF